MQDSALFWADIKKLEEQLANSPESFCFARLSDIYLKVGLIDDALHVARQGVMKHPRYLAGQRALALACHAKGLNEEALAALQLVTEALPEDVSSQKLLGRLYAEAAKYAAASQVFRTALEFAPDDAECRIELELLGRSAEITETTLEADEEDEGIIEDLEILEELDILDEDQPESELPFQKGSAGVAAISAPHHDPLSTGTLAELYVRQGFIHKALEIYRAILADNPADRGTAGRVAELEEALEAESAAPVSEDDDMFEEEIGDVPAFTIPAEMFFQEIGPEVLHEFRTEPPCESQHASADVSGYESGVSVLPLEGVADNALAMFDGWLENIRRIKSCR